MFITKWDNNGNFLWAKNYGDVDQEQGSAIAVDDNFIYTTGRFQGEIDFNPGGTSFLLNSEGKDDNAFILKIRNSTTATNELLMNHSISLFPNPVFDVLFINTTFEKKLSTSCITIIDLFGKIVLKKQLIDGQNSIEVKDLSSGIYILQLQTEKGIIASKFMKK